MSCHPDQDSAVKYAAHLMASSLLAEKLPETAVFLPPGFGVESVEKHHESPTRMRRKFSTSRLKAFGDYLKKHAHHMSAAFIHDDLSRITGVINHGDSSEPMWGDDTATLNLNYSPAFAALHAATRKHLSQAEMVELLEDWGRTNLQALKAGEGEQREEISLAKAISAVRRITISRGAVVNTEQGDFSARKSSLEEVEAKGTSETLPDFIGFHGEVFPDTDVRFVQVRLGIITAGTEPKISLRIIGWEALKAGIADELESKLKEDLPDVAVYFGNSGWAG